MTQPAANAEPNLVPRIDLMEMMEGYRVSQAIYVAARLGVADHLTALPISAEEVAQAVEAHPGAVSRLVRALAALGLVSEPEAGRFVLTPLGALLRADHPQSLRDAVLMYGSEDFWLTWGHLLRSVQTGESATRFLYGEENSFTYFAQHPDIGTMMNAGLAALGRLRADAVVSAYPFPASGTLVDVGGGRGQLLATLLRAYPGLHGILFDQLHVVTEAESLLATAGVTDRCRVLAGDMFADIPSNGDIYLLMNVLHDWDDAQALTILTTCHHAMPSHATLLIIEQVLPSQVTPSTATRAQTLADLNMLVRTGGRERTVTEFRSLLEAAGLIVANVVPTQTAYSVISAVVNDGRTA